MTKEEYIDTNEYGYDENKGIWSKYWEKFLEGRITKKGYVQVKLKCTDGKQRLFQYHRVIWYLAYGTIPEGYEVNHIDENKQNNALSNLNLMTHIQNINHGTRNERHAAKMKNHPLKSKPVMAVDKDGNVVLEFASTMEASRHGFNHGAVSNCCRNCYMREGNRFFKGYYWYYKEDYLKMKNAVPHKRETA